MNYYILSQELDADPLGRGYSGMDDAQAADDLNIEYRSQNIETMTPTEIFNRFDMVEWGNLIESEQRKIWDILHMGNPLYLWGNEVTIFVSVFGGGSTTISNLQDARVKSVSRGYELGFRTVRESDVTKARALP